MPTTSYLRQQVRRTRAKGQRRRRLHLPERRRHGRHRRLHVLRQPQLQPQPPRAAQRRFADQIDDGIRRLKRRYDCDTFLAYFQPATNTYAPVERLRPLYEAGARASAGRRPWRSARGPTACPTTCSICLSELAGRTYLSVEYGMQTMHDRSLDWMNRGHHHDAFLDAMRAQPRPGLRDLRHVMLGLPGESHDDMLATARELARLRRRRREDPQPVRRQEHAAGRPSRARRSDAHGAGRVRPHGGRFSGTAAAARLIVERISGDAPPDYFIGPAWCLDKPAVRRAIDDEFTQRDTRQGRRYTENTL